jgi:hypothetical protein
MMRAHVAKRTRIQILAAHVFYLVFPPTRFEETIIAKHTAEIDLIHIFFIVTAYSKIRGCSPLLVEVSTEVQRLPAKS